MCLVNVTTKRAKIATEDIPCFKVLRRYTSEFRTPYMYVRIVLGRSYTSNLDSPCEGEISEGIHAVLTLEQARYIWQNLQTHCDAYPHVIVKCIIPKGAKYYIGQYYEQFKNTAIAATEIKYGHKPLK